MSHNSGIRSKTSYSFDHLTYVDVINMAFAGHIWVWSKNHIWLEVADYFSGFFKKVILVIIAAFSALITISLFLVLSIITFPLASTVNF